MKKTFIYILIISMLFSFFSVSTVSATEERAIWLNDECISLDEPVLENNHGTYIHVYDLEKMGFSIENLNGDFLLELEGDTLFVTERSNIVKLNDEEFFFPYPTSGQKYIAAELIRNIYCMDIRSTTQMDAAAETLEVEIEDYSQYENELDEDGAIIAKEDDHSILMNAENPAQLMASTTVKRVVTIDTPFAMDDDVYINITLTPEYNEGVYGGNVYNSYIYRGSFSYTARVPAGKTHVVNTVSMNVSADAVLKGFLVTYSLSTSNDALWQRGYCAHNGMTTSYSYIYAVSGDIYIDLIEKVTISAILRSPDDFDTSYFRGSLLAYGYESCGSILSYESIYYSWGGTSIYGSVDSSYKKISMTLPSTISDVIVGYRLVDYPTELIGLGYYCENEKDYTLIDAQMISLTTLRNGFVPDIVIKRQEYSNLNKISYNEDKIYQMDLTNPYSKNDYIYISLYNNSPYREQPTMFIAYYGKNNKLLYIGKMKTTIASGSYGTVKFVNKYDYAEEVRYTKTFLWDDTMDPYALTSTTY